MRPAHMPVEVLRFEVEGEDIGENGIHGARNVRRRLRVQVGLIRGDSCLRVRVSVLLIENSSPPRRRPQWCWHFFDLFWCFA